MSFAHHRKIYEASDGEAWWLCRERGEVFILQERASGEMVSKKKLEDFLRDSGSSPQKDALMQVIGSLAQLGD
jgi:hypothetical protein